ncbi:MAG: accessory gene regulator B family protein [Moorella humiferrea]|nr:accessory gene regulator B family protein [Moorella humiferrea]
MPQTLAAFTASALFRLPPGGAHCTGFARCLFGCIVAFTAIGILARFIGRLGDWTLTLFYIVLGLAILLTLSQVPVDNPSRPVKKLEERVRMQKWATKLPLKHFPNSQFLTPRKLQKKLMVYEYTLAKPKPLISEMEVPLH